MHMLTQYQSKVQSPILKPATFLTLLTILLESCHNTFLEKMCPLTFRAVMRRRRPCVNLFTAIQFPFQTQNRAGGHCKLFFFFCHFRDFMTVSIFKRAIEACLNYQLALHSSAVKLCYL